MVKIMENPIKMDDLGVPLFSETSIYRISIGFLRFDLKTCIAVRKKMTGKFSESSSKKENSKNKLEYLEVP